MKAQNTKNQTVMSKTQKKASQIQKTIDKLNAQLEELRVINNKDKNSNDFLTSDKGWKNDKTISMLDSITDKLVQINLIK